MSNLQKSLQTDIIVDLQARALKDLSKLELSEILIDESFLLDTSKLDNTGDLDKFVATFHSPTEPISNAAPQLIALCSSALRTLDLIRDLRKLSPSMPVAKLFAKHMKLEAQVSDLRKKKYSAAAGTPDRILKLLHEEALELKECKWLVIDSWKDAKGRWILDDRETARKAYEVLAHGKVLTRLKDGKMRIVVF
ncbi:hypothetical protein BT69DRAFT_1318036 [Atractiella rhizophila]|nr:hypothetical protein BT69DRAFT_1318036 [Atractiella rhizophila]